MHFDKVVLQNREPNTDALWAKPDGDKISLFVYNNGKWVPIGGEGGSGENGSTQMKFVKEVPANANPNAVYAVYEDED